MKNLSMKNFLPKLYINFFLTKLQMLLPKHEKLFTKTLHKLFFNKTANAIT